jgi:hypothetical protein
VPALVGLVAACNNGDYAPKYHTTDSVLAAEPLYFYPAAGLSTGEKPRAFIFFLGNDVAFWKPHQWLATRLSNDGYAVVGLDLKKWLDKLPGEPKRDSAFRAGILPLLARARGELHADSLPLILGGHSFGAEVALYMARYTPPPHLVGVLALSTRSTGHLTVTIGDLTMHEASGPDSWSTIDIVRQLPDSIRVALIRGQRDQFVYHDSAFVAAGGTHLKRYLIPFAGHSLKDLLVQGPIVDRATKWILDR